MNTKYLIIPVILIISLISVLSIPPLPTDFYGTARYYDAVNTSLLPGTLISVFAGSVFCGNFTIVNSGYYGLLTCLGDDNYTGVVEGAIQGQNIIFYINGQLAQTSGDTVFYQSEYKRVDITPTPRCGNGVCELTESCITCAEDCGICPTPIPVNITPPSGGPTGRVEGGGGGGPTGGGGTGGGSASGTGIGSDQFFNISFEACQEDWACSEWKPEICPIEEEQTRQCYDRNRCGTIYLMPDVTRPCIYQGTCFDLVQNQDETDIDCGGQVCEPCDLNKTCLFDFDCKSGFCNPVENVCREPTCNDGFRNQGEEQVDCGGPCFPCERPTLEKPGTVARFIVRGCGPFPWAFVIISTIVSIVLYIIGRIYIRRVQNSEEYKNLKKLDQLVKVYNLKRQLKTFVLIAVTLSIAIALYLYYLCETGIWLILILLVIAPIFISILIKYYVYDEHRKAKKLKELVLQHQDYLLRLIKIERQEIRKEETSCFEFLSNLDYKKMDKNLAVLLKDIRFLLEELLQTKEQEPFELENTLVENLHEVNQFEKSELLAEIYPTLTLIEKIHRDILLLYKDLESDRDIVSKLEGAQPITPTRKAPVEHKAENLNDPLFKRASSLHNTGKLSEAEKIYLEILSKNPQHRYALYFLASLYNRKKLFKKSFELYEKLMKIDQSFMKTAEYYNKLRKKFEK